MCFKLQQMTNLTLHFTPLSLQYTLAYLSPHYAEIQFYRTFVMSHKLYILFNHCLLVSMGDNR